MATKKYLSLSKLTEYDGLIKEYVDGKDSSTLSSAKSYTNTEIAKITNGTTVVSNATHAVSADSATTAGSATKATQDGNGKVISEQYETKADASAKLTEAKSYTDTEVAKKANALHGHDVATTSASGFMSTAMVTKLSGIAEGANKTTVDSSLSTTSTNPVQNKVVNSALSGKVPTTRTVNGKALSGDISLSASDVGADASGTASSAVSTHNSSVTAHSDIRDLITGLTTRLNALADSDDTTLDQLSEIVAYIKSNKSLIDGITTSKVSVSDIVDNLTSTATNKPLSAKQGKALKDLIDTLTATVDGKANSSSLTSHTGNGDIHVTATQKTNWTSAYTHSTSAHAPSNAEKNQNAFSNVVVNSDKTDSTKVTVAADSATDSLNLVAGSNITLTGDITNDKITIAAKDTTYSANNGISLSGTTFSNSGVRSIATGGTNGTISVNTGGTTANVSVKGLGGAAYTNIDTALSTTSTNPIQNKVVASSINTLTSTISTNTSSISSHTVAISALQEEIDSWEEITSQEIQQLFQS